MLRVWCAGGLLWCVLAVCLALPAVGSEPATSPAAAREARWQRAFRAFDLADRAAMPAADGLLVVGSSSIALWPQLRTCFPEVGAVIKRGIGGLRMLDALRHVERLVVRYRPSRVVVYAGENDLADGRSVDEVVAATQAFIEVVRARVPRVQVAYVSMKPSPRRRRLVARFRDANARIAAHLARVPGVRFIDVFTPMLGTDGQPRAELFSADGLHLNERGYALWCALIAADLRQPAGRGRFTDERPPPGAELRDTEEHGEGRGEQHEIEPRRADGFVAE